MSAAGNPIIVSMIPMSNGGFMGGGPPEELRGWIAESAASLTRTQDESAHLAVR
jgi:hypothetical protein